MAVTWIKTRSGRLDLADPSPDDVHLDDIAYSLARQRRFNGNAPSTVACHSVHVSLLVPPDLALCGLLHDAAETYTGDVPYPLKHLIGDAYTNVCEVVEQAVAERFDLPWPWPEPVQEADMLSAQFEARTAWGDYNVDIGLGTDVPDPKVVCYEMGMGPHWWEEKFKRLYQSYRDGDFEATHPWYEDPVDHDE